MNNNDKTAASIGDDPKFCDLLALVCDVADAERGTEEQWQAAHDALVAYIYSTRAAPAAGEQKPVLTATHGPLRLTNMKTADIAGRGYNIVGYVLRREDGEEVCISAESAVRWLPQAHYWRLMHEQDGSLFATPTTEQAERDARDAARLDALLEIDEMACVGLLPGKKPADMRMQFKRIINEARAAIDRAAQASTTEKGGDRG